MEMNNNVDIPEHALTQHYDILRELGDCFVSVADYQQAQEHYDKAASLAPDEPLPYIGLGVVAFQQGKLDDAEIAFKVARRLDPKCAKAYGGLAMVAQQRQNSQEALELYLKCLELDNDNLTALLGLFQTSCQMGSFAKVTHYLEVYLNIHSGDTAVMFCLATLYMKDGKLAQARQMLLDVLVLDPLNKDAANLLEEVEHSIKQEQNAEVRTL
jgi:tetratricopeptide (TPR) repeat protein